MTVVPAGQLASLMRHPNPPVAFRLASGRVWELLDNRRRIGAAGLTRSQKTNGWVSRHTQALPDGRYVEVTFLPDPDDPDRVYAIRFDLAR